MIKIKTLFSLACTLLMLNTSFAQDKNGFGVKAGMNFNKLNIDNFDNNSTSYLDDTKNKTGFHAGIFYNFCSKRNNIVFQPGLNFIQRGTEASYIKKDGYYTDKYDFDMTMNYLEIPLTISYNVAKLNGTGNYFRLFVEPAISFALSGKIDNNNDESKIRFGNDLSNEDQIKPINVSLKFGASVKINSFEPYLGYDLGLNDINNSNSIYQNRGFYIGLSYHFKSIY
ncbi:PorT family protein [Halosquirtibacter xylanolyticus]|uniref:porin family protein n=1 Tax=Halosquirtibacter xylanolyticus TaxID=3374599 RepID=UPI00374849C5|nr:PorT family protein [Prolixibacteraceae bacterium]